MTTTCSQIIPTTGVGKDSIVFAYNKSRRMIILSIRLQDTDMKSTSETTTVIETTLSTSTNQQQYKKTTLEKWFTESSQFTFATKTLLPRKIPIPF